MEETTAWGGGLFMCEPPMTPTEFVEISSRPEQLAAVADWIARHLPRLAGDPVTQEDLFSLQLAAQELCANSIEHAYAGVAGPIFVGLGVDASAGLRATLTVEDRAARPFDPSGWRPPDLSTPPAAGGLGLWLVAHLMDELFYWPGPGRNCWQAVKRLYPASPGPFAAK